MGIADPEGNLIAHNDAMREPGGYSREDIARIGNVVGLYADPAERQEALRIAERQGYLDRHEVRFKRKDGTHYDAALTLRRVWLRGEPCWQAVVEDVTDKRKTEEERVLLAAAIEQAAEGIVITDTEGTIQYVNPAFEQITGYPREAVLGGNPRILKSGEHGDAFYRNMWETIAGGEVWSDLIVNRRKDGTLYEEEMTIAPVRDSSGQIVNYVAVKHDVSERHRLQRELLQAQKMEAVGQLAGGVAHDRPPCPSRTRSTRSWRTWRR